MGHNDNCCTAREKGGELGSCKEEEGKGEEKEKGLGLRLGLIF